MDLQGGCERYTFFATGRYWHRTIARAIGVRARTVERWILAGWMPGRRVWRDWSVSREHYAYTVRGLSCLRGLRHPMVVADILRERTERLEAEERRANRAGREGRDGGRERGRDREEREEVPRPSPLPSRTAIPSGGSDRQGPDGGDHNL